MLERLAPLVGGEWVSRSKLSTAEPAARFTYSWEREGKTLRAEGRVGSTPTTAVIGWDPAARKTYYLDIHGPGTLYFGHATVEGDEVAFDFRNLIGDGEHWHSRERLVYASTYRAVLRPAKGAAKGDLVKIDLVRPEAALPPDPPQPPVVLKPEDLHPILARLELLIGGTWKSEARDPSGKPFVELSYRWGSGRKTIVGKGAMAGMKVESVIGWDPKEEKLYYLDRHGPETVYFGHYTIHDEDITVDFRTLVGRPGQFRTNAWFSDTNTYMAIVRPMKDGQVGKGHKVKLVRTK